jgi:hypothetical protein
MSCWADLASDDAERAYQALWAFVAAPGQAVPFLRERLHAVAPVEAQGIARRIAELDSDEFAVREKAMDELDKLGQLAESALRTALANHPSPELRRRAKALLARIKAATRSLAPERLRALRSVEVLERIGTVEARQVLKTLASGAPEAELTRDSKASLDRLTQRPAQAR